MKGFERIRNISSRELAVFGMQDLAYVKPVVVNGVTAFAVHAADGTQVVVLPDREIALATVRQHDLEALSVH
ncbi:MAG: DUF1150 family protein [Alphaproteobacteria bacterium]|nr:DUF1150 family protein [Alphaproteobacteria bacterium]MBV9199481.1 DUF1150 family protein [Alphaproteobacteria bacterium]MBV9815068.1 DUF1150 family protein [Alphaproteobacteria bacterium]